MGCYGHAFCRICLLPIQDYPSRYYTKPLNKKDYEWIISDQGCAMNKLTNEMHDCEVGVGLLGRLKCNVCKDDTHDIYHGDDDYFVFHKLCYKLLIKVYNEKIKDNDDYNDSFANNNDIKYGYANVSNYIEVNTDSYSINELHEEFKYDGIYDKFNLIDVQNSLFPHFTYHDEPDRFVYLTSPEITTFSKNRFIKRFEKIFPNIKFH